MSIEILDDKLRKSEDIVGPFNSDVVREITEQGQIVWLNSAPEDKTTSDQETLSPKV